MGTRPQPTTAEFLNDLAARLGAPFRVCSDAHFAWLTPFDERQHELHARIAGYGLRRLHEMIPGLVTVPPAGGWPAVLLPDVETQLRYDGQFAGSGAQIISGGTYRSYPIGHLAIPVSDRSAVDAAFAHELVHAILSPRQVPVWIQEGIACEVETRLGSRSDPFSDAHKLNESIRYWRSHDVTDFWNGTAFGHPDSATHTYLLAQIIARRWTRDPRAMAHLCTLSPEAWTDQDRAIGIDRELLLRSVVDPQRRKGWLESMLYAIFVGE